MRNQSLEEKIIQETRGSTGFSFFGPVNITDSSEQAVARTCGLQQEPEVNPSLKDVPVNDTG